MRSAGSALVLLLGAGQVWGATAAPDDGWARILSAVNLRPELGAAVILPSQAAAMPAGDLGVRLRQGWYVLLEGSSKAAESFGFKATSRRVVVRSAVDSHDPNIPIVWEQAVDLPVFDIPAGATIFSRERWAGAPLAAGLRVGAGGILWVATDPGVNGRERFPYVLQALRGLGLEPLLDSRRLWVFLDTSYRMRVDPDYMARLWRRNGIAALHIAAWHYQEPDEQRDLYLRRLIGALHRNAIHVYAWLELPHVSEVFWQAHPEWREQTASGADAHLDWRKLMNLRNPGCAAAVKVGVRELLRRFDWDGVNLAELYFESLEGHSNPSRFTPMNSDIRQEFRQQAGFDPLNLFQDGSERHRSKNPAGLSQFLHYRAVLAERIQQEWIGTMDEIRKELPHLDLVLTHVDNLLEPETRDRIGADARRLLPLLDKHDLTFLVEDPATAWSLGPERYPKIAAQYAPLVRNPSRLAIDINVVDRYQDVYPTKQQTGVELFQELHLAANVFSRVTLYVESSLRKSDWPLVGAAAASVKSLRREPERLTVNLAAWGGVRWQGAAMVDGALWPFATNGWVWLPPGEHVVEKTGAGPALALLDLNAEFKDARVEGAKLEFAYESQARAFAILSKPVKQLWVDGIPVEPTIWVFDDGWVLVLPRGQHIATISPEPR
ncbi:MAG TPA: hypothetical protein VM120_28895 [Bryobacteraceae bacterium]|nr:hypothetical protein [Bryobacteraceae bacterium]